MAAPVEALGAIGSVLGIIDFIAGQIPSKPDRGATVRVKLGLGEKGNQHGIVRSLFFSA